MYNKVRGRKLTGPGADRMHVPSAEVWHVNFVQSVPQAQACGTGLS